MTEPVTQPLWENDTALLPAIVQHAETLQVLMLGYMNRAAWEHTLSSGQVTFFSRSRQRQWTKGETSGHTLQLVSTFVDCDQDTILVMALPAGPTCHRNTTSCFGEDSAPGLGFLAQLAAVIDQRAAAGTDAGAHASSDADASSHTDADTTADGGARPSYTASLLAAGTSRVAQKVGEEAVETVIAAMKGDLQELTSETADLLYHLLVLLHDQGCKLGEVIEVLRERHRG